MFKKSYIIVSLALLSIFLFCFNKFTGVEPDQKIILKKICNMLTEMHVASKKIDDEFSKEVFKRYLFQLDPYKKYFKKTDFDHFKKYETKIDDYFINGNIDFYNFTLNRFLKRVNESEKIVNYILNHPIKLDIDEYLILDNQSTYYTSSDKEYFNEWKKILKYYILIEMYKISEGKNVQDYNFHFIDNIDYYLYHQYADIKNFKKKKLSFNQLKKTAINLVKEIMKEYFRKLKAKKKKDYFSTYLNSLTETFDPHTIYFSPKDAEQFHSNISGKIIGIGVKLNDLKGHPVFSEIIVGGPAWKSKEIEVGDKLLKIGEDIRKLHNVVGLLLEDTIALIRGKENSKVFLVIQKKNGKIKTISVLREEIELDDFFVKSVIIKNNKNEKFGLIYLPEFYTDLQNPYTGRHCSEDFKQEILALKKENIKGLIIDLRGNGGGSLLEVVKIVGQFIKNGPVVKVRRLDGYEQVYEDKDESVLYDGSLLVIVDEFSASASEIFAAAIQDYKRGIILGSTQTFGKGTVQSVIPLDQFGLSSENVDGFLKLTIQKFYRITGSSTQLKGVVPDIILTSLYQNLNFLEVNQTNSLPWDSVGSVDYIPWDNKINFNVIKNKSKKRIERNVFLKKIQEKGSWLNLVSKEKKISLHYKKNKETFNIRQKNFKKYDKDLVYSNNLIFISPKHELLKIKKNRLLKYNREKWYASLLSDCYLSESIDVLSDINKSILE